MPTLSVVKVEFTTVAKWLGIIIAVFIGLFLIVKTLIFIKEAISPTPPKPPEAKFGKLPEVLFPQSPKNNLTYKVDTITGDLPNLPDRSKVYKMVHPEPNLLAVQRANEKVASLGFSPKPEQISDIFYRWKREEAPFQILTLNVNQAQLSLSSSFIQDKDILSGQGLPGKDDAISIATGFLQSLELYPNDIDEQKTLAKLIRVENGSLLDASSISSASIISVYFFSKDKDNMPIVYPQGKRSSMNITISGRGSESTPQIIDGRFFYQKPTGQSSVYGIKTAAEAFDELKKGGAYIASLDGISREVLIKNVYLAYYVEGQEQDFLMPVIVFEGNDGFVAYVSAVKDEMIRN